MENAGPGSRGTGYGIPGYKVSCDLRKPSKNVELPSAIFGRLRVNFVYLGFPLAVVSFFVLTLDVFVVICTNDSNLYWCYMKTALLFDQSGSSNFFKCIITTKAGTLDAHTKHLKSRLLLLSPIDLSVALKRMDLPLLITLLPLMLTEITLSSASKVSCTGCSSPSECNATGNCTSYCTGGGCNMTCSQSVKHCGQICTGRGCDSNCEAENCKLGCTGGGCTMTCPPGVKDCHLICTGGGCDCYCDADNCKQDCVGGCTNTNLPDGVACTGGCHSVCDAGRCTLGCTGGGCDMTCPESVKYCDPICTGGGCHSKCEAENCTLECTGGGCNMTCPAGVKHCHLICVGGGCDFNCDADNCKQDCVGGCMNT